MMQASNSGDWLPAEAGSGAGLQAFPQVAERGGCLRHDEQDRGGEGAGATLVAKGIAEHGGVEVPALHAIARLALVAAATPELEGSLSIAILLP